jgi:SPP1 gp7 family putative phage head morphogenesis protein
MVFDDYDKERLFEMIYAGLITAKKLPKQLFKLTFTKLLSGMEKSINYDVVDKKLIEDLKQNLYLFSGAKTEVQVLDMVGSMVQDGKLLPYNEFKKIATEKFDTYNKNYLRTEYDTAVGQSQMVSQWSDIYKDKKLFPYLKYDAILDSKTSDICKHFDGVTLPVNDNFWSQYSPLNHFNCRCEIIKLSEYDEFDITKEKSVKLAEEKGGKNMNDIFKMNPYHDRVIFSEKHPYFEEAKNYKKQFVK